MRESFAATIAFAVLTLFMVFLAHLAGFAFAGEPQHAWGLLVTILAAAVSYAAQHDYTNAAVWVAHHQKTTAPGYSGPADPDAFQKYEGYQRRGTILHLLAVALCMGAVGLFWLAL